MKTTSTVPDKNWLASNMLTDSVFLAELDQDRPSLFSMTSAQNVCVVTYTVIQFRIPFSTDQRVESQLMVMSTPGNWSLCTGQPDKVDRKTDKETNDVLHVQVE